jgi:cytochrome c556
MIRKMLAVSVFCLCGASFALAAVHLGHEREAAMKRIGHSAGALVAIVKGKTRYNAATVKTSLETISSTIKTFPEYFPEGSQKADRRASPKIWENNADFKARAAKLGATADTLLASLPTDRKGVTVALRTLGKNCSGCHHEYRLRD